VTGHQRISVQSARAAFHRWSMQPVVGIEGEVLNLLEIEGGVHPLLRNQKPMPVGAGASKEAPHDDENTGIDAHPPIPFRPD
jgi:hypothetical protein